MAQPPLPGSALLHTLHDCRVEADTGPATPAVLLALAAVACAAYGAWLAWLAVSSPTLDAAAAAGSTAGGSAGGELVVDDQAERREHGPGQLDDLLGSEAGAP